MAHPYRAADTQAGAIDELVYPVKPSDWGSLGWKEYAAIVVVCVAAQLAVRDPFVTIVSGTTLMTVFFAVRKRRAARGVVLRFEGGDLLLRLPRSKTFRKLPLEDLLAVELDTRTVATVQRDTSITGQLTGATRVAPPSDESRIILVLADPRQSIPLTEFRVRHDEALEWTGKLRVFLRKHGWVPEAERET